MIRWGNSRGGNFAGMFFSKSFGYALRSVLYLADAGSGEKVQLNEIAAKLKVPRHFLGKVMKKLAKEGIIQSQKGPGGGFVIRESTMTMPIIRIAAITGETAEFDSCVLKLRKCNSQNPCPMHQQVLAIRNQWLNLLSTTTVHDLLKKEYPDFIKSIAAV